MSIQHRAESYNEGYHLSYAPLQSSTSDAPHLCLPAEIRVLTSHSSTNSRSWPLLSTATSMPSLDGVYFNISKQHGNTRPSHLTYKRSVEDYFFDRSPSISRRSLAGPTSFSPVQRTKSAGFSINPGPNRTVKQQKNGKNADYRTESLSRRELFFAL